MNYFKKNYKELKGVFLTQSKTSIVYVALGILIMSTVAFIKIDNKTNKTSSINYLITTINGAKAYTLQIAEAMPAEKYTFKPIDSVRSFGEQMAHIATSSQFLINLFIKGEPMPSQEDFEKAEEAEKLMGASKTDCIKALSDAYDIIISTYKNMSDDELSETFVVPFDPSQPAFAKEKAFQFIGEHTAHHRGQALVALRMQGIKAPNYKLY